MNPVTIDVSKISELDARFLAAAAYDGLMEHFNSLKNQRRFEEWKKKRVEDNDKK